MAYKVLVVKAEQDFASALNTLKTGYGKNFALSFVAGRKEAMTQLQTGMFDRIVTGLKIPRISDGYLFLSYIAKTFAPQKITVVVDEKSDEVMRSIKVLGIKQIFSASNVQEVLQSILEDSGLISVQKKSEVQKIDVGHLNLDKIQNALNWVMGPVGNMIFRDVSATAENQGDFSTLIDLIAEEIGDEKKVALFRDHLKTQ
ncbi:MAG: hypothetical protein V2B20_01645 [Pseudomonadota bacterium]